MAAANAAISRRAWAVGRQTPPTGRDVSTRRTGPAATVRVAQLPAYHALLHLGKRGTQDPQRGTASERAECSSAAAVEKTWRYLLVSETDIDTAKVPGQRSGSSAASAVAPVAPNEAISVATPAGYHGDSKDSSCSETSSCSATSTCHSARASSSSKVMISGS